MLVIDVDITPKNGYSKKVTIRGKKLKIVHLFKGYFIVLY